VGHHQVCLEYVMQGACRGGEGPRSRYVGSYLWIALGNYGTEVFLTLRFREVSHATVL